MPMAPVEDRMPCEPSHMGMTATLPTNRAFCRYWQEIVHRAQPDGARLRSFVMHPLNAAGNPGPVPKPDPDPGPAPIPLLSGRPGAGRSHGVARRATTEISGQGRISHEGCA